NMLHFDEATVHQRGLELVQSRLVAQGRAELLPNLGTAHTPLLLDEVGEALQLALPLTRAEETVQLVVAVGFVPYNLNSLHHVAEGDLGSPHKELWSPGDGH